MLKRILKKIKKEVLKRKPLTPQLTHYFAGQLIAQAIQNRVPFFAGRLGFTESRCLDQYITNKSELSDILGNLWKESGVFPPTEEQFSDFAKVYLGSLADVDLLGLLETNDERRLLAKHGNNPLTCALASLEPYLGPVPWSQQLAGLRVLVVHPFVQSIREQYLQRELLFANKEVLPQFKLLQVKPPQTLLHHTDGLVSWSAGLEKLCYDIKNQQFDVAILGCGAYGLPAGAFIKTELKKIAIYLGGATQILFGISGKRWVGLPAFQALKTPYWKLPLEAERPERWEQFEGGCYW